MTRANSTLLAALIVLASPRIAEGAQWRTIEREQEFGSSDEFSLVWASDTFAYTANLREMVRTDGTEITSLGELPWPDDCGSQLVTAILGTSDQQIHAANGCGETFVFDGATWQLTAGQPYQDGGYYDKLFIGRGGTLLGSGWSLSSGIIARYSDEGWLNLCAGTGSGFVGFYEELGLALDRAGFVHTPHPGECGEPETDFWYHETGPAVATSARDAIVVDSNVVLFTGPDGTYRLNNATTATLLDARPGYAIWASSATDIWLILDESSANALGGSIVHSDGVFWAEQEVEGLYRDVWGSGSENVWAVGGSVIAHYGDAAGVDMEVTATSRVDASLLRYDVDVANIGDERGSEVELVLVPPPGLARGPDAMPDGCSFDFDALDFVTAVRCYRDGFESGASESLTFRFVATSPGPYAAVATVAVEPEVDGNPVNDEVELTTTAPFADLAVTIAAGSVSESSVLWDVTVARVDQAGDAVTFPRVRVTSPNVMPSFDEGQDCQNDGIGVACSLVLMPGETVSLQVETKSNDDTITLSATVSDDAALEPDLSNNSATERVSLHEGDDGSGCDVSRQRPSVALLLLALLAARRRRRSAGLVLRAVDSQP